MSQSIDFHFKLVAATPKIRTQHPQIIPNTFVRAIFKIFIFHQVIGTIFFLIFFKILMFFYNYRSYKGISLDLVGVWSKIDGAGPQITYGWFRGPTPT